jgi:hypothetical protein
MKYVSKFIAFCIIAAFFFSCSTNTEKCLQKLGYQDCEHLKKAFNLQNKDEAIRYHDICVKCGCKE